jgi:hypothetical protein
MRQLISQSSYKTRNSVLILHGVAAKGDKAAAAIFTTDEHHAFMNVPNDYAGGRNVLVALGILPPTSDARSFAPISEVNATLDSLHELLSDRIASAEADLRVIGLADDKKYVLLTSLAFLRIELAIAQLYQIYGQSTAYDVLSTFSDPVTIEQLGLFRKAAQKLTAAPPGLPLDFALLDAVMNAANIEVKSEEDFIANSEFLKMGTAWLNEERVEFLDRLRLTLRKSDCREDALRPED